jgi:molybdopterin synthase sulfur carrier subunit
MKVRFYATLRPLVGGQSVEVAPEPGATLWQLLDDLIARYPALGPQLLVGPRELGHHIHVILNGRDAPYLERGMDTVIGPEDRVDIFPPVGGG